jgi:hypothetical protein
MNKRGISPLIATVFLIGISILIGSIVLLWSFETQSGIVAMADEWAETKVLKYSAEWPDRANCTSLYDAGESQCEGDRYYCILVENLENEVVNYMIVTRGSTGSEVCSPDHFELGAYESKVFVIQVHKDLVGEEALVADVSAVQKVDIN